jgi:hypothetical protein
MKKRAIFCLIAAVSCRAVLAQAPVAPYFPDSARIIVHPSYDKVGGVHRWLFGDNYRWEWATEVKLPLIDIEKACGGLTPLKEGGGMETRSVRLKDRQGREWVIRSVEKVPDNIVPVKFRNTFAVAWVDDSYSAQHPYSALIVPPLADAAGVPHTNPVIGVLVAHPSLGDFSRDFAGRAVLLEEREPGGHSENTAKILEQLNRDHNNRIDGAAFLRARLLDVLLGDWDRHVDQWRWIPHKAGGETIYTPVPRDRDQVFHVMQGVLPSVANLPWIDPVVGDFNGPQNKLRYSPPYKSAFLAAAPSAQLTHQLYTDIVNAFVKAENDEVLEAGLKRLPPEDYRLRHGELLIKLKERRNDIPRIMEFYYRFINRLVDIRLSDKDENISVTDGPDQGLHIRISKAEKGDRVGRVILDMNYLPVVTSEVRLYTMGGSDQVTVNTSASPVKLRIVDSAGAKSFDIRGASSALNVYGYGDSTRYTGNVSRLKTHYSADTNNVRYVPSDPYNVWMPLLTAEINRDDGLLPGLGFRYTGKGGFRKIPFSNRQEVLVSRSFKTGAFRLNYSGQWMSVLGKADLTLKFVAEAPDNTMNFSARVIKRC